MNDESKGLRASPFIIPRSSLIIFRGGRAINPDALENTQ